MRLSLQRLRAMVWHFRHGGIPAVRTWRKRQRAQQGMFTPHNAQGAQGAWIGRRGSRRLVFAAAQHRLPAKPRRAIRVATILDEFSERAFAYEWESIPLTPQNWQQILEDQHIDLLFVESAWHGSSGAWKYHLTGSEGPSESLCALVQVFSENAIPTVFWNKEDPPHYQDFLATARLFDHVFTSDSNRIPNYTEDLGHGRVTTLAFAAQPALHNPIRPRRGWHNRDVAFAGMYFSHRYPERREQMDMLLGAAASLSADMDNGLEIFSRQLDGDEQYQFPEHLSAFVVGSLPYEQMMTAYKAYKVFLNVNSVVDSPSMCARRVFEITASGTPVVSTRSQAIDRFFPPTEVPVVDGGSQARSLLAALVRQPSLGERQVHLAQRRIWREHTYAHRAEQIIGRAVPALSKPVELPSISVIVSTMRPHQLEHVFRTVSGQLGVSPELVLLTHGFTPIPAQIRDLQEEFPLHSFTLLKGPADRTLGECLNDCVSAASGTVVTKMDDDDYYGPNYLQDQLHALNYSGAEIVGKQAHYMYLQQHDATLLRFPHKEHRFTNMVMGPTIMAARTVFREFPFEARTKGEDTAFLGTAIASSASLYSSDKFNYYQQRNGTGHTWQVSDFDILASSDIAFYGKPDNHVSI